jgi:hypothetical protein
MSTLGRLLGATGWRLTVARARPVVRSPRPCELRAAGTGLVKVIALAEALPVRHRETLAFPRLSSHGPR